MTLRRARRRSVVLDLAHPDDVPLAVILHLGHEPAHEEQTAAAGTLDVLDGGRVWDFLGIETGSLVGDGDVKALQCDLVGNEDALVWCHLFALRSGVDALL